MQERKGRNGGTLKSMEKGETANPNGRPVGSISLKSIADKILDGKITVEDAQGKYQQITRREAMLLRIIEDSVNDEDPNVRHRAAQIVMDRTEGRPLQKTENINVEVAAGEMDIITPEKLAALEKALGDGTTDNKVQPVPGKRKGQG